MDYQTPRFGRIFVSFGWMSRMNKLLVLACISCLPAEQGATEKKATTPLISPANRWTPFSWTPLHRKRDQMYTPNTVVLPAIPWMEEPCMAPLWTIYT